MTRPVRLRLSRAKGFSLQERSVAVNGRNATACTRPGRWGNPFPIGRPGPFGRVAPDAEGAVGLFTAMLDDPELRTAAGYPASLEPLRGRNLACHCRLGDWCHADVLLMRAIGVAS